MASSARTSSNSHLDYSYRYPVPQQPTATYSDPYALSQPAQQPPTRLSHSFSAQHRAPTSIASPGASMYGPSATFSHPSGTAENPLIPKRRRRTTPAELAILEAEFRSCQRPDPLERARIAERLGMTARAVQVWYQNRRQKEKKDSTSSSFGSSSSVTSSGSDPKDLDGVVLSFSSSPLPSPNLNLFPSGDPFKSLGPSSELYAVAAANKENSASSAPVRPAPTPLQSSSSSSLATQQQQQQYTYSYPSGFTAAQNASTAAAAFSLLAPSFSSLPSAAPSSSGLSKSTGAVPSVYIHRPHNASIIAAKKHVRKRPLGSHAPLARTPSLPHAFEFPPSPPKHAGGSAAASIGLGRRVSLNDVASGGHRRSVSSSALSFGAPAPTAAPGLFAAARGETVAAASARRRSSTPLSSVFPSPALASAALPLPPVPAVAAEEPAPSAKALPAMTPASKARKADDLLRHMESDPPSASSPIAPLGGGLTRRRMAAHEAGLGSPAEEEDELSSDPLGPDEDDDDEVEDGPAMTPIAVRAIRPSMGKRSLSTASAPPTFVPYHPKPAPRANSLSGPSKPASVAMTARSLSLSSSSLTRSTSLGPLSAPATASGGISLDATLSRSFALARAPGTAGASAACAKEALGRKRARMSEAPPAGMSVGGVRAPVKKPRVGVMSLGLAAAVAQAREEDFGVPNPDGDDDEEEEMADLSFSSTSTASTVDSVVTVADSPAGTGYFNLPAATAAAAAPKQANADERECAELLLGLGGFF
ncbi:hypothetical protein JCM8097_005871 [Rhodosporidiobolus ruineniae]